jgi:hypothetical protein
MDDAIHIKVFEVVGSPICVASDDGQAVYERVASVISSGRNVVLSFVNVTSLTSAFLNTAIGQLYSRFDEQAVRDHVIITEMGADDAVLLKRVVDTAKSYFRDPGRLEYARDQVMGRR